MLAKSGASAGRVGGARSQETEIGDLIGPVGSVDARGVVRLIGESWRLEWAVGSEDRWRMAADETGVRQSLLDDTPVTVTALRVAGGDVVQRVAGVSDGTGRAVSIEVENQSPAPVALALAVRPDGSPGVRRVTVEAERVTAEGRDVLVARRRPGAGVTADDRDLWSLVRSDSAPAHPAPPHSSFRSRSGSAAAAVVVPVPHRQQVAFRLPVAGPLPKEIAASSVAAGWRGVADRAASVEVADPDWAARWRRSVPAMVLAAGTTDPERAAALAPVLDLLGLPDEADRARATLVVATESGFVRGAVAAATARALASRRLRSGRESGLDEMSGLLVRAGAEELSRSDLELMADALEREDEMIARDLRELATGWAGGRCPATGAGITDLVDPLVSESARGLELLPESEHGWLRGPIDVRGMATRHGGLSFSVRWHDERPALLWELGAAEAPLIRCPVLDPSWSSTDPAGEVLLGVG